MYIILSKDSLKISTTSIHPEMIEDKIPCGFDPSVNIMPHLELHYCFMSVSQTDVDSIRRSMQCCHLRFELKIRIPIVFKPIKSRT